MPYHVRLWVKGQSGSPELKLDLDEATLERQFVRPYREGRSITVNGRTVEPDQIHRVRISHSDVPSKELIAALREDDISPLLGISRPSFRQRAAGKAQDVTDEFIQGPPGTSPSQHLTAPSPRSLSESNQRNVFLVHGQRHEAVEAMRQFLTSLDLKPIEWEQAVQATGKASPFIAEILDAGFSMAHAAVVLMTPDDVAFIHPDLRPSGSAPERLTGQPRPNVIFEAGMAWQKFRDRTLLVEFGHLRGFSDLAGVHVVRLDGSAESRRAVASRLKTIECAVDDSGDRWLTAGHFPSPLRPVTPADLGFELTTKIEPRGTVEPVDALRGVPLRWVLLARLAQMHREQANSAEVLVLDVEGIAVQALVEITDIKSVLAELIGEGLVEGYAESFGQAAVDGACRITAAGLRRLRAEA
jgi:predicted nucleotide-binding protein